jgi:hypothetical protein
MWEFHVSKDTAKVNLFQAKEVCTHNLSNKVQLLSADHQFSFANEDVWQVSLMDGYLVEATLNGGPILKGKWSPIYDQSMVVQLENGQKFVTNFRYNLKGADPLETDAKQFANIKSGDYDKFDSKCD